MATSQREWQNTINPFSVFFIQTAPHCVDISASITLFLMANIGRGKEHLEQFDLKNLKLQAKSYKNTLLRLFHDYWYFNSTNTLINNYRHTMPPQWIQPQIYVHLLIDLAGKPGFPLEQNFEKKTSDYKISLAFIWLLHPQKQCNKVKLLITGKRKYMYTLYVVGTTKYTTSHLRDVLAQGKCRKFWL